MRGQVSSSSNQYYSGKSTKNTKVDAAPKLWARELRHDSRKGNRLKDEKAFRPRWITIELFADVKGMSVFLHGLHPVPINRWTVLLYCSRWFVLAHASRLYFCLLSSRRYKCESMLFLFIHDNIIKIYIDNVIWLFMSFLMFHMLRLSSLYTVMTKVCPSWPSSKDRYILREIMLRRTKGIKQ